MFRRENSEKEWNVPKNTIKERHLNRIYVSTSDSFHGSTCCSPGVLLFGEGLHSTHILLDKKKKNGKATQARGLPEILDTRLKEAKIFRPKCPRT